MATKNNTSKTKPVTESINSVEKAKQLLEAEDKKIDQACINEIEAVLKKHKRSLIVSGQFQGNQIQTAIAVMKTN